MPTPTPDPFADGGLTTTDGEVPVQIQTATGASTWQEVAAWMDKQFAEAGALNNFVGSVRVVVNYRSGAVQHGPEIVLRERKSGPSNSTPTPPSAP